MISAPSHNMMLDNTGLALDGKCEFSVNADRVLVEVDAIRNLRDISNLSGSLAVELWALKQPLNHAEPENESGAQRLAATTIGEIRGQHFVPDCRYDLLFEEPTNGSWQISLLLREWNGQGYSTCDAVDFPVPYLVNVDVEAVVEAAPAQRDDVSTKEASVSTSSTEAVEEAAVVVEAPKKKGKEGKAAKVAEPASGLVCINTATVDEIAEMKGVSRKVAKEIVAHRPYTDLNQLLDRKGIGEKLLRALRPLISLN